MRPDKPLFQPLTKDDLAPSAPPVPTGYANTRGAAIFDPTGPCQAQPIARKELRPSHAARTRRPLGRSRERGARHNQRSRGSRRTTSRSTGGGSSGDSDSDPPGGARPNTEGLSPRAAAWAREAQAATDAFVARVREERLAKATPEQLELGRMA